MIALISYRGICGISITICQYKRVVVKKGEITTNNNDTHSR